MRKLGVVPRAAIPGDRQATLIELENKIGNEHWLGFNNFFRHHAL